MFQKVSIHFDSSGQCKWHDPGVMPSLITRVQTLSDEEVEPLNEMNHLTSKRLDL